MVGEVQVADIVDANMPSIEMNVRYVPKADIALASSFRQISPARAQ